jgi:hypothetical protein
VHNRVDTLECRRVDATLGRIPTDLVAVGNAAAPQAQHVVPVGAERRRECASDEPACPADHDVHDPAMYDVTDYDDRFNTRP